jgi:predicted alpha-1,6-mannanase (GH76 family)
MSLFPIRNIRSLTCLLLSGLAITMTASAAGPTHPAGTSKAEALQRTRTAAAALVQSYDKSNGLFTTTGWWNSANAITALADESRVAKDQSTQWLFPDSFTNAQKRFPAFLNDFYDDEGWWALAWIDVYDLHPKAPESQQYLHASEAIFDNMAGGWDDTCRGGIWWKKDRHYKNAIANELFLSVAARLALHTRGKERARYLDWANREWRWFSQSGMINSDNLINDGLDASCRNNGKTTWTYNQGVVLGGLAALSKSKASPDALPAAKRIAYAAISHLTDANGILHDPCEPACGEDGVQFKGIFNRNLAQLQTTSRNADFAHFLEVNADSIWSTARTPENQFSTVWSGPPAGGNAGAQVSALDALVAAAASISKRH